MRDQFVKGVGAGVTRVLRAATFRMLAVAALVVLSGCTAGTTRFAGPTDGPRDIRVLLVQDAEALVVTATKGASVQSGGVTVLEGDGRSSLRVTANGRSLAIELTPGGRVAALETEATVVPKPGSFLSFAGTRYAGAIRIHADAAGRLTVVNVLPLETYLEGVVPHEIGDPGAEGYDAVRSQAVAARTYAFAKMQRRREEPFDVHASVLDQVYRGVEGQRQVTTAAVRDTRGRVLTYHGQTIRAYYSACCGGHTSDIRRVWPHREPAAYLTGRADRRSSGSPAFCRDYYRFRWRVSFSGRELGEMLRRTLPAHFAITPDDVGSVRDLRVADRSPSGRVTKLRIETTEGNFTVRGDSIRWVLMADVAEGRILPSVMFRLEKTYERDRVSFVSIVGGGNGHGVGMCQNGAIGMARRGYTYEMILAHYYPDCAVTKVY